MLGRILISLLMAAGTVMMIDVILFRVPLLVYPDPISIIAVVFIGCNNLKLIWDVLYNR